MGFEAAMAAEGEALGFTVESLKSLCKTISEELSQSGMLSLLSLIDALTNRRIRESEFSKSIEFLFENDGKNQQDVDDSELEEGEIREYHVHAVRAKVDDKSKEYPIHHGNLKIGADVGIRAKVDDKSREYPTHHGNLKIGADVGIRAKVDDKSREYPTHHRNLKIGTDVGIRAKVDENPKVEVSDKRESEKNVTDKGNKRRILHVEPIEKEEERPRKSRRLTRVTPSYKLIPEEDRFTVKDKVLNNQCSLIGFDDASSNKKFTKYEETLAICEDEMFEADMLMEPLKSAVESGEKVIEGEKKVKKLEELFYKSIENLCRRDKSERERQDHKQGVREMLPRLKHKLNRLTIARQKQISGWKKVIKENTAKQRELEAKQRNSSLHKVVRGKN